jgi:hypothetical protein
MIELSVGLPMFKSSSIAWLALESLARQEKAPPWELIVCEEEYHENKNEFCGPEFLEKYEDILLDAGCEEIKFLTGDDFIPLEKKWKTIHAAMSPSSKYLCLQGSDDYSSRSRLARTQEIINKTNCDWYSTCSLFYHIKIRQAVFYEPGQYGVFIAARKELLNGLPDRDRNCSVDTFLKEHCEVTAGRCLNYFLDNNPGVCTDGYNRISKDRAFMYSGGNPEFKKCPLTLLNNYLPPSVFIKLMGMGE